MRRIRGVTAAVVLTAMLMTVLVPLNESEAAEPTVVFSTDFEGIGVFIQDWAPLGWSRGDYAYGHDDDLWCRANADVFRSLSTIWGYTMSAHSSGSALCGAKLGYSSYNGAKNIDNGYPDAGMDSWVRYAPPNAASYDGMTLTFWYWAKTQSADYSGDLLDYLCVNINDGTQTTTVWKQPSPDSNGWRMATVDMPAGTVWMEWEFKTSTQTVGHYPGVYIDDMTVTTGRVLPGPPTSHVGGMSAYYNSRSVQVPVSMSDADRISLDWRASGGEWARYADASAPDGLFTRSPITFQAPSDGRYEVRSIASNATYVETKSAAEASFTVDTAVPTVTITSPAAGFASNSGTVTIAWTASDLGSGVGLSAVAMDDGHYIDATGSYTFNGLAEGTHTATVLVNDRAGNAARASLTFTVDLGAPAMTVSPTGSGVSRSDPVVVTFQSEVDKGSVTITVNGVSGSTVWDGSKVTFTPHARWASNTTYEVTVAGQDASGDAFSKAWSFTTLDERGSISGTVRDGSGNAVANATVTLSNGMTVTTDANGRFAFTGVPSGSYTLNVTDDGYKVMTKEVEITDGQADELGALSLEAGENSLAVYYGVALWAFISVAILGVIYVVRWRK